MIDVLNNLFEMLEQTMYVGFGILAIGSVLAVVVAIVASFYFNWRN